MMRLIGLSAAALSATAALSACAPTTGTLAEFNAEQLDRRAVSALSEDVRQSAERLPYGQDTPEARANCPSC